MAFERQKLEEHPLVIANWPKQKVFKKGDRSRIRTCEGRAHTLTPPVGGCDYKNSRGT